MNSLLSVRRPSRAARKPDVLKVMWTACHKASCMTYMPLYGIHLGRKVPLYIYMYIICIYIYAYIYIYIHT